MTHESFLLLAYGLTAALMAVEPLLVWRRHRAARRALGKDAPTGAAR
jgi:heme exporter protein CcmD